MRNFEDIAEEHIKALKDSIKPFGQNFSDAVNLCTNALTGKGKILVCGNGGSAADAQHFAAELVGRYETERRALPAIALSTDTSAITAIGNDYGFDEIFARQIQALGNQGDILIAISTSGNSSNILKAADAACKLGIKIIAFTGQQGGGLGNRAEVLFATSSDRTARIQEIHEICLHALAEAIETKTR
ncbi:MAG: SIS domain-containing protein [Desulfobacteraceae bacterium]|nr:SIS domain-containing protein [Desulfobacteraceae bacterium]MCF8094821.1 SIS domain-containing protein [Desulfobacteraceae bacterium]